jgi:hypothetical protein
MIHIAVKVTTAFNINKRIVQVFLPSALSLYVHRTVLPQERESVGCLFAMSCKSSSAKFKSTMKKYKQLKTLHL